MPPTTLRALANNLRGFSVHLEYQASDIAIEVATAISNDLIQVTPVDTGTAMSNWQVEIDQSATDQIPAFDPSPRGKIIGGVWTHTVDPAITHSNNVGPAMDAASIALAAKQPGQIITITNNLPYIQALDNGHSTQTPAGFVDRALLLAENIVKNSRIT